MEIVSSVRTYVRVLGSTCQTYNFSLRCKSYIQHRPEISAQGVIDERDCRVRRDCYFGNNGSSSGGFKVDGQVDEICLKAGKSA